jgi:heme/copper-type cytochrome/quinol oxidase subunit 2
MTFTRKARFQNLNFSIHCIRLTTVQLCSLQEGFAFQVEADWLVRIYFMSFIIITLVVLQVVISFIVEAFVFKIQAREKARECTKHHKLSTLCGCKGGIIMLYSRKL